MNSINIANSFKLITVIILTLFFLVLFFKPILLTSKFILRGVFFSLLSFIFNIVTSSFGFTIGINLITGALFGFLGISGVLTVYVIRLMQFIL